MKESAFRTAVLGKLPAKVHRQPMLAGMMGTAGTPDTYLDFNRDLWIEWKCLSRDDHLPARIPTNCMPTPLQVDWLDRRFKAGGNAVCIVGLKRSGRAFGFVLSSPAEWSVPPVRAFYEPRIVPAAALATYILERVS